MTQPSTASPRSLPDLSREFDRERAQLAAIVASSSDGILSQATDGTVLTWNRGMERIFGYTADEMVGRSYAPLVPPDLEEERRSILQRVVRQGETVTVETERLHRDGRRVPVALTVFPVRDAAGGIGSAGAIVRDISQQRMAEAALRESERLLREAQQVARLGSWRWEVATDTLVWSDVLCELYGIPVEAAPRDFAGYLALVHPDDRANAIAQAERAVRDRQAFAFDHRVVRRDGGVRRLHGRGSVVCDAAGNLERVIGSSQDVTERVAMEEALRESETRYRALADATPAFLWQNDAEGRCVFVNRAWTTLTGRDTESELGLGWLDRVHPDDVERVRAELAGALRARGPVNIEYRVRGADGEWRWLLSSGAPRFGEDGTFLGHVGSCVDLTERKAAEAERERLLAAERTARAQAEAANRAKGEFLAVMSHELRTPLNAIGGYVELLELGLRGPLTDAQREDLERVRRSQRHLLTMISEILEYARVEAGRLDLRPRDVVVTEVLERAEAIVAPLLRARRLTLSVDACSPALTVHADPERLAQVLVNLLGNAAKFTPEGGTVALACAQAGAEVRIDVRDDGPGIDPAERERIFEPFYQVDRSLTRTAGGVGLGLAISRDLVHAMNGRLTLESEPGAGSTFTVTLPAGGRATA